VPNGKARAQGKTESTTIGELVSRLPKLGGLAGGSPLPIPAVPGVPPVSAPQTESARVTGPGTRLHITLGDVRQAASGHAIAARATAIKIAITQSKTGYGDSAPNRSGVILDLDLGVLEAAAVAPEPSGTGLDAGTGANPATAGAAGGLPITGPRIDVVAIVGAGLLLAGAAALLVGRRRRRLRVEP
jgi:LPXTG-motif cell wall-anchored protein